MMSHASEPLCAEAIRRLLPEALSGVPIHIFPVVGSTNREAKRRALEGAPHGSLFLAEAQTEGRGRLGRAFYSPPGTGLYMSVLLRPGPGADTQLLTVAAAVAVCRAMERLTALRPQIKWVNDIYCAGRKVCGILAEAQYRGAAVDSAVVGIGVNCTTESFPAELAGRAGSLAVPGLSRNALAAAIVEALLDGADSASLIAAYRERSLLPGKRVTFTRADSVFDALVLDIDGRGRLLVRHDDGRVEALESGEVTLHRP